MVHFWSRAWQYFCKSWPPFKSFYRRCNPVSLLLPMSCSSYFIAAVYIGKCGREKTFKQNSLSTLSEHVFSSDVHKTTTTIFANLLLLCSMNHVWFFWQRNTWLLVLFSSLWCLGKNVLVADDPMLTVMFWLLLSFDDTDKISCGPIWLFQDSSFWPSSFATPFVKSKCIFLQIDFRRPESQWNGLQRPTLNRAKQ